MASRPTEKLPVAGRVDRDGRLVAADPALERLQVEAGSALGRPLALPQLAALARSAASLGVPLSRALLAADRSHDLDLFVRAEPHGDEVLLSIERWAARPAAPPRLTLVEPLGEEEQEAEPALDFVTDASLAIIDIGPDMAARLGRSVDACLGQPLTALFRLVEEADGAMPLLAALATRGAVDGQRATIRGGDGSEVLIDAQPASDDAGQFAGFIGTLRGEGTAAADASPSAGAAFEESLDEALRSPLARIIAAADRIVERGDGPLRSDYANYATDIAAAGRHLLSVIRGMGADGAGSAQSVDLVALAAEAEALVQPLADARSVTIRRDGGDQPILASGEARGVVQVLVNILGNAIRHSGEHATVFINFARHQGECHVTIADQGEGIAAADQQRIFERYERVGDAPDGSGLGLAISRRLARSMGGDIRVDSAAGEGARFTLILPAA